MWLHTEPRAAQASGWFKNDIQHDSMQSFYAHSVYLTNKIAGNKLSNPITFLFILHAIIIGCLFLRRLRQMNDYEVTQCSCTATNKVWSGIIYQRGYYYVACSNSNESLHINQIEWFQAVKETTKEKLQT